MKSVNDTDQVIKIEVCTYCHKFKGDGCEWKQTTDGLFKDKVEKFTTEATGSSIKEVQIEEYLFVKKVCPTCEEQGSM
ncbi:MAG: hypothetical protein ISR98_00160 [Parcubacteria group bacterium]|nr:hypothetical protein [Parcubacteria group bacterium]